MTPPLVSIVVPNWQGEALLAKCLSSLQISARTAGHLFELIVVDDASADGSCALVTERFPRVKLLRNPRNMGFARSVNRGVKTASGRILVLANNDLCAQPEFIGNLARWFLDDAKLPGGGGPLFAVSARTVGWYDGKPNQLCMGAVWKGGRITPAWDDPREAAPCLFAQAGAAAYDRTAYMKLGGLSPLFEPGYWEDYDLSWRAAKAGYAQIYDPAAFALHVGGGSMTRRYGADGVADMKARNHLLFEAANLRGARHVVEWCARLPWTLVKEVAAGMHRKPGSLLRGLGGAAPRLAQAAGRRLDVSGKVSDLSLLAPFRHFRPSY